MLCDCSMTDLYISSPFCILRQKLSELLREVLNCGAFHIAVPPHIPSIFLICGLAMMPRLALSSWAQAILSQPLK